MKTKKKREILMKKKKNKKWAALYPAHIVIKVTSRSWLSCFVMILWSHAASTSRALGLI